MDGDTPMLILDEDAAEIAEDATGPYLEQGVSIWRPYLGVDDIRSVRATLAAQVEDVEGVLLYRALAYFQENDAFLRLGPADLG